MAFEAKLLLERKSTQQGKGDTPFLLSDPSPIIELACHDVSVTEIVGFVKVV